MTDTHCIQDGLAATIRADGAELCSLRDEAGRELLWQAGPLWPNHSPVLFPIVGQVGGDRIRVGGETYPLTRHGFARRRRFAWVGQGARTCSLALQDDAETRAVFPFAFRLEIAYRIEAGSLHVDYAVSNPGPEVLPASLGAHPAFRWPLAGGGQTDYRLEFDLPEPASIHRLRDGLLDPDPKPTPVNGTRLDLDPALFRDDAIIMLEPRSRSLRYLGPDRGFAFSWFGFPQLGLWQKPGAEFVCLEPWHGYSSPAGWDGPFSNKPGVMHVAPGERRTFGWSVRPLGSGEG